MPNKAPNTSKPDYSALVPAVEQASRILLCLADARASSLTLTEIATKLGIHKSKAYSILNTLQSFNFVRREEQSKTYSLGVGLLHLSSKVLDTLDVREAAEPLLEGLARATKSTALFVSVTQSDAFVVAKDEGAQDIGLTIRLGHKFPLAWGAHGKAIVSALSDSDREKILSDGKLYFHGSSSALDKKRLASEMAECRRTGFATDLGEMKIGVNAVAGPVLGLGGKVVGALVVLGTFPKELAATFGALVALAVRDLSTAIGGNFAELGKE